MSSRENTKKMKHDVKLSEEVACNNGKEKTSFNCLPPEVKTIIFSYLTPYELIQYVLPVCSEWKTLAFERLCWHRICVRIPYNLPEFESVKRYLLHRYKDSVRCLILKFIKNQLASDSEYASLSPFYGVFNECFPKLKELCLEGFPKFPRTLFKVLVDNMPRLQTLTLCHSIVRESSWLKEIHGFRDLKALDISHCAQITDDDLIDLANNVECLESLNIDDIDFITNRSVDHLAKRHSGHLCQLHLYGKDLDNLKFLSLCSNLEKFSVSWLDNFNDSSLLEIQNLPELKVLELKNGKNLTKVGLLELFNYDEILNDEPTWKLLSLTLSYIPNIDNAVVDAICNSCKSTLIKLELVNCPRVTDGGIKTISSSCRKLKSLTLEQLELNGDCSYALAGMPRLDTLDVLSCCKKEAEVTFKDAFKEKGEKFYIG